MATADRPTAVGVEGDMRIGVALFVIGLVAATDVAGQPPVDAPPRLKLENAVPAPTPERRENPVDWTTGLDIRAACPSCPADDRRPPAVNGNAPWMWSATWVGGTDSTRVSVGLVGQRNTRLPLFMTQPLGGTPQAEALSSLTPMGDSRTRWQVTLGAEQTLWERATGPDVGLLGDAFLPLPVFGPAPRTTDAPTPAKRAVRGGFRVRF